MRRFALPTISDIIIIIRIIIVTLAVAIVEVAPLNPRRQGAILEQRKSSVKSRRTFPQSYINDREFDPTNCIPRFLFLYDDL
jgi:hypothetical protein